MLACSILAPLWLLTAGSDSSRTGRVAAGSASSVVRAAAFPAHRTATPVAKPNVTRALVHVSTKAHTAAKTAHQAATAQSHNQVVLAVQASAAHELVAPTSKSVVSKPVSSPSTQPKPTSPPTPTPSPPTPTPKAPAASGGQLLSVAHPAHQAPAKTTGSKGSRAPGARALHRLSASNSKGTPAKSPPPTKGGATGNSSDGAGADKSNTNGSADKSNTSDKSDASDKDSGSSKASDSSKSKSGRK